MDHLDVKNVCLSRRLLVVLLLLLSLPLQAMTLDVSESPRSNLVLSLRAILSAQKSIAMNAYELTSNEVADALIQKINEGIRVELLQEGQPVGGLEPEGEHIQKRIAAAMEANSSSQIHRYFVMTSKTVKGKRRFRYNHAKYIVVDEATVLVGSENYSPSGQPDPGSTKGTRGWQTFVYNPQMARNFLRIFEKDCNTKYGDLITLVDQSKTRLPQLFGRVADWVNDMQASAGNIAERFSWMLSDEPKTLQADNVELLTSPDSSLNGLLAFIQSAKSTLDVELMSFNPMWGRTGEQSPLLDALVAAAKRNVRVRILINDSTAFGGSEEGDLNLVKVVSSIAKEKKLPMQAMIADVKKMGVKYVHNKGALADGHKTLISSINWNQNSVENNRETAISVDSKDINAHYQAIFDLDWEASR
jgi:cardiolipin synthase